MANIILRQIAEADLDGIWDYIAASNPDRADSFIRKLTNKLGMLANNPLIGVQREEYFPNLRMFPIERYLVFYLPLNDGIEVIRILPASRDIDVDFFQ
ncbi:MAG: type II toxin-antitoxin system RelE/ParE family toxin [Cyanosarcina radialis HA8281-LM2]|jgi:toxin ParE1/3/4|nr:type II toxin-antitoxin system RelE/ParE family toxin [Cyanosarcina radialis HA8281-LM2]